MAFPSPIIQIWDEDGSTALGILAERESLTISDVLNDVGSLQLKVARDAPGADLLLVDADRQLRVILPDADDQWFLFDEDSWQGISDDPLTEPVDVTCRSLAAVFDEAKVIPSGGVGATPAEWAFTAPTPGKVITDLVASAQARGLVQSVTVLGGAVNDATGNAWAAGPTVTYKAGTSLLSVLKGLSDSQLLEWRMAGRVLELHAPGEAMDVTLTTPLRPRRDVESAPVQRSRRAIATSVLVEGESGANARRTQALAGRREREAYLSQTSAPSGSLNDIGDLYLDAHAVEDIQLTHDLTDGDDTLRPFSDYRCGYRLPTIAGPSSGVSTWRVAQIALAYVSDGAKVTLELGSILATAEEQFARQIARLLPGEDSLT